MRHKRFSFAALLMIVGLLLASCGGTGGGTASQTTTTGGAATAAPAGGGAATAAAGAEPTAPPPSGMNIPDVKGLRTDLKGATVTAILSANENIGPAVDRAEADKFTELTGIKVNLILGEKSATDRLAIYRQQLSANSGDVDVYQIDV